MNQDVEAAIKELTAAFPEAAVSWAEDGSGGAYVILDPVDVGPRLTPRRAWLGGHISTLYPAADIYPVFMDAAVRRADGRPFEVPVTTGANFQGRPAIQISRRNNQIGSCPQSAVSKVLKILHFLENLP